MNEKALTRIKENKNTKAPDLNLSYLDIKKLSEDMFKGCDWVNELNLSHNQIRHYSFLFSLINLTSLNLSHNQIGDFSVLSSLTNLTSLELSDISYNRIVDYSFLSSLTNLTSLNLSSNKIKDLSFLSSLTNLTSLNLSSNQIKDFSFLSYLTNLTSLNLSYNGEGDYSFLSSPNNLTSSDLSNNQIKDVFFSVTLTNFSSSYLNRNRIGDLSFLSPLTNLHSLDLRSNEISGISFPSTLTNLHSLDLSQNRIQNISFPSTLINLYSLNLSDNQISLISLPSTLSNLNSLILRSNQISDLSFLSPLTNLHSLDLSKNRIQDISLPSTLTNLHSLDLSKNRIQNISFPSTLTNLYSLNLSDNQIRLISLPSTFSNLNSLILRSNEISDISFPCLPKLCLLNLSRNRISFFKFSLLKQTPNLNELYLRNNPIQNIQPAIYNQDDYSKDNCLIDLKTYIRDLEKAALSQYEAKLLIIGNGRVGKTCIVKRWLDNTFDKDELSTHAIQLRQWPLPQLAKDVALEHIRINIWDFGGQDIYHATHRFFMRTQAIFLLVWDNKTENDPYQQEIINSKKIVFKNYHLLYWLSYIKTQSDNSPVIVVQTKASVETIEKQSDHTKLSTLQKNEHNIFRTLAVDSEKSHDENGFEELETTIKKLFKKQIKKACTDMPEQWYWVQREIAALAEKDTKQISLENFTAICVAKGLDESSTETLLRFLHNSGVFFYKQGIFNNQIVIDQRWAINAVYTLFNRAGIFVKYHQNGLFTGEDLEDVWHQYTQQEQELFISFMKQCEVCFEIHEYNSWETPFSERKYIAPQLLSEEKPDAIGYIFENHEGIYFKYWHRFLHAAIIQQFIVRIGFLAKIRDMWKEGILLKINEGTALIEAFSDTNELVIRIKEMSSTTLLSKIRNELKEIQQDEEGIEESVSLDGKTFVSLKALKNHRFGNEELLAENETWVKFDNYRMFLNEDEKLRFDKIKPAKQMQPIIDTRPSIYFSYAWKDLANEDREKFVAELYESLYKEVSSKYQLKIDKEDVTYKDSIAAFMKKIGHGDLVVVAISDKYLKSEYCMYELHELYIRSNSDTEELRKKILPVRVENLDLKSPKVLGNYLRFWKEKVKEWEDFMVEFPKDASPQQTVDFRKIRSIKDDLGVLIPFIADMNTRTKDLLAKNNFQEIKIAIQKRMEELKAN